MAKIRHIAYRAQDVEAMAAFFVDALEMTISQRRANGAIDLSDGTINVTLLPLSTGAAGGEPTRQGIDHIGFTVADEGAVARAMEAAGAREIGAINLGSSVHYELKFKGPEGIVVDIGHWVGAAPIEEPTRA
jgi:catechol 2,3-dioxygenase-like lactoylglutathione lyase family enzyme